MKLHGMLSVLLGVALAATSCGGQPTRSDSPSGGGPPSSESPTSGGPRSHGPSGERSSPPESTHSGSPPRSRPSSSTVTGPRDATTAGVVAKVNISPGEGSVPATYQ